ncbi:MAG: hypothetical protein KKA73_00715 [Chloroflexi bacterium]|nr:hypothetical protein [Chloroflexota bacterium]MBU1746184.1 hypothetical protein [Chloroflexota bacterium]
MSSLLPALFGRKPKGAGRLRYTVQDMTTHSDAPNAPHDAQVNGGTVALYRPPVCLDAAGRTAPGVSRELVARYLAATASRMTDVSLGPVNVEWKEAQGRFVLAGYQVPAFDVEFEVVHPAGVIDQAVADMMDQYHAGVCVKTLEMMKGHQRYADANRQIRSAHRKLVDLRDVAPPVLTTPEFLFLDMALSKALVLSALPHLPEGGGESVIGQRIDVS